MPLSHMLEAQSNGDLHMVGQTGPLRLWSQIKGAHSWFGDGVHFPCLQAPNPTMEVPMHAGDPQSVSSGQRPHPNAPSQVPLNAHVRGDSLGQTPGMRGGTPAASGEHNPSRPAKRHESHPLSHRLSQHTSSAQKPLRQSSGNVHFVPGRPLSPPASSIPLSFFGPSRTTAASGSRGGSRGGPLGTVQDAPIANPARAVKTSRRGVRRIVVTINTTVVALQSALCSCLRNSRLAHHHEDRSQFKSKTRSEGL